MNACLLFVHALSPLHAGTGQGIGVIDLPIAREKSTGLPYLPGSSVKGTLRDKAGGQIDAALRHKIFGPDTGNADDHAGSVQFSDQRLLLLPVRSLAGTFAWVTSPFILRRLLRDAQSANITDIPSTIPNLSTDSAWLVVKGSALLIDQKVVLEDLDLQPSLDSDAQESAAAWANWIAQQVFPSADDATWQQMLRERFCIVHDDMLSFLLDTATEVIARIKLDENAKTVDTAVGGLWYEEALPTETILAGLVVATPVGKFHKELDSKTIFATLNSLMAGPAQFGGKATVGRGLCRLQTTA